MVTRVNGRLVISERDARSHLGSLINRVAKDHDPVVLKRGRRAIAAIVPISSLKLLERLGDAADIAEAQRALADPFRIPWQEVKQKLGL